MKFFEINCFSVGRKEPIMANRIIGSLLTNCFIYDVRELCTELIFKKIFN